MNQAGSLASFGGKLKTCMGGTEIKVCLVIDYFFIFCF